MSGKSLVMVVVVNIDDGVTTSMKKVFVVVVDDADDGMEDLVHDVGLVNMASVDTCKVVAVTIVALGVVIISIIAT